MACHEAAPYRTHLSKSEASTCGNVAEGDPLTGPGQTTRVEQNLLPPGQHKHRYLTRRREGRENTFLMIP
jgi:hypothetical protein